MGWVNLPWGLAEDDSRCMEHKQILLTNMLFKILKNMNDLENSSTNQPSLLDLPLDVLRTWASCATPAPRWRTVSTSSTSSPSTLARLSGSSSSQRRRESKEECQPIARGAPRTQRSSGTWPARKFPHEPMWKVWPCPQGHTHTHTDTYRFTLSCILRINGSKNIQYLLNLHDSKQISWLFLLFQGHLWYYFSYVTSAPL